MDLHVRMHAGIRLIVAQHIRCRSLFNSLLLISPIIFILFSLRWAKSLKMAKNHTPGSVYFDLYVQLSRMCRQRVRRRALVSLASFKTSLDCILQKRYSPSLPPPAQTLSQAVHGRYIYYSGQHGHQGYLTCYLWPHLPPICAGVHDAESTSLYSCRYTILLHLSILVVAPNKSLFLLLHQISLFSCCCTK